MSSSREKEMVERAFAPPEDEAGTAQADVLTTTPVSIEPGAKTEQVQARLTRTDYRAPRNSRA